MNYKNCPLDTHEDWVKLKTQVGKDLATYIYVKKGWDTPPMTDEATIRKKIGLGVQTTEVSEDTYWKLVKKMGTYNSLNRTSHFVNTTKEYSRNGKKMRSIRIMFNYLSGLEESARREAAKTNPLYRVERDYEFKRFPRPIDKQKENVEKYYTPENNTNYKVIDGEIVNLADAKSLEIEDYLIPTAAETITKSEQSRRLKIQKEIALLTIKKNNANDPFIVRSYLAQIENLKQKLNKADERIKASEKIDKYNHILDFGNSQLAEIKQLLSNPAVSAENIVYADRILSLWQKASDFTTDPTDHIFLDEYEFNSDEVKQLFREIGHTAEDLQSRLSKLREEHILTFIREYHNNPNLTREEVFADLIDPGKLKTLTLNLGRNNDPIIDVIYAAVEQAHINARLETNKVFEDIDEVTKRVLPKLKNLSDSKNPWRFFEQKTENGLGTGKIVHRFSDAFFQTSIKLKNNAFYKKDKNNKESYNKTEVARYYKWLEDNTITFDARKLIEDSHNPEHDNFDSKYLFTTEKYSEAEKQEHINKLKIQLGEIGYTEYIERLTKKIDRFKIDRAVEWDRINMMEDLTQEGKEVLFRDWNIENSPYWAMELLENPELRKKPGTKEFYKAKGLERTYQIPLKSKNGKATKWYDANFEKIESDKDLLDYYNVMFNTLKEMRLLIPADKRKLMGITDIPKIKQTITDMFSEKGLKMGLKPIWNSLQEMSKTTDLSVRSKGEIDFSTGERIKDISIQYIENTAEKVNALVKTKIIEYKTSTGVEPDAQTINRFKEEARNEISQEYSFDLTKLLKAYSSMALAYKHKSIIEPQVRLLEKAFLKKKEIITNKANLPMIDKTEAGDKIQTKEGLANLKSQLDFYLNERFWNIGSRKVEGVSKTKTYTVSEKEKLNKLEELFDATQDAKEKEHLQAEMDKLGGYVAGSAVGDMVQKLMTYKGLAYNLGSAFSNVGFGIISNLTEASDGRNYTMEQMRKAYILTTNSIGKNLSLNTWEGVNGNAVKIRSLMDKWDLLKTSDQELYDMSDKSSLTKKLDRFKPMSMQYASEYLNYAPVMIAIMMNFKATAPNGDSVNLWEAYDTNGELKEGYKADIENFNESKLVLKIKRVIEMNHGDYNNPLQAKETITGRMLSQFRTWMFEGFANRFEAEKVDNILSYGKDKPFIRKGRYRSYTQGQLAVAGATLGTTFLPGIGTAIGGGLGFVVGKFAGMKTDQNAVSDILFTLRQLARKLMFKPTNFKDRFTEADAANMRKNMTELYMLLILAGIGLVIASVGGGEDDDERMSRSANFLLNQMTRLETDIAFYTNPLEFEKLTKTAVPMAQLVSDTSKWMGDVFNLFDGDSENDVFQSGLFKDDSKLLVHTGELIPGISTGIKLARSTSQIY